MPTGQPGMQRRQPQSGWFTRDGIRLHYVDWPTAESETEPPLLCLHGLTANARYWDGLVTKLPNRRLIALDLRGRGQSDRPEPAAAYGLNQHVPDCIALIRALNMGPVIAVGHSMGAFVAALLAATAPDLVNAIALIDGAYHGGSGPSAAEVAAQIQGALARLTRTFPSFAAYETYWREQGVFAPWNEFVAAYLAGDVLIHPDGTVTSRAAAHAVAADMQAVLTEWDGNRVLPQIHQPAYVLWAPEPLVPGGQPLISEAGLRETARLLPNSRFQAVTGANHYTVALAENCIAQVVAGLTVPTARD